MSMHLVGPYMTTTKYNRKKKKPNARQLRAQEEHDKWLTKMGVHPDQLAEKKANRTELVVVLTPRVITNAEDAQDITDDFRIRMQGLKDEFLRDAGVISGAEAPESEAAR